MIDSYRANQTLGFVFSLARQINAPGVRGMAQKVRKDLVSNPSSVIVDFGIRTSDDSSVARAL